MPAKPSPDVETILTKLRELQECWTNHPGRAKQVAEELFELIPPEDEPAVRSDSADNGAPSLTVKDLKALCAEAGIDVPKRAKKADLETLLAEHAAQSTDADQAEPTTENDDQGADDAAAQDAA